MVNRYRAQRGKPNILIRALRLEPLATLNPEERVLVD